MTDGNKLLTDLILFFIEAIIAIVLIPIIIGVIIALLLGATGFNYFAVVFLISIIIWLVLGGIYWI